MDAGTSYIANVDQNDELAIKTITYQLQDKYFYSFLHVDELPLGFYAAEYVN